MYQATVRPGGRSCLSTDLVCAISGLTNGTTYTATVRALTGAGWSESSTPSASFTPRAPKPVVITITGGRLSDGASARVEIAGGTTLPAGTRLTAWFKHPGQDYQRGVSPVLVDTRLGFTWSRISNRKLVVHFTGPGASRSNTISIPART